MDADIRRLELIAEIYTKVDLIQVMMEAMLISFETANMYSTENSHD